METVWFIIVALAIAAYVVLDGFDLGSGYVSALVARTPEERRQVIDAIGPFWDGNEVWLLAGGGALYMAFPKLYASSFAGFYLPLMFVLWLLMLRGIAIEFGGHVDAPLWRRFWDTVFAAACMALPVFYGAALGNVVRGVPLDSDGIFFLPLWTTFSPHSAQLGVLDWYTVLIGLTAAAALAMHGALWVNYRTAEGPLQTRSIGFARQAWRITAVLTIAATLATFSVQPLAARALTSRPWALVFPLITLAGLWIASSPAPGQLRAFLGSAAYLGGMLTSAAASLYPYVLPARPQPELLSLTIENARADSYALEVAIYWWLPAAALTAGYFVFLYRRFAGLRVGAER